MKGYFVFNVEQIDGLPGHFYATAAPRPTPSNGSTQPTAATATGATIRYGGGQAFYSPGQDVLQMPPMQAFRDQESYYAKLAHEMTHNADSRIMPTEIGGVTRDSVNRAGSSWPDAA